MKDVIKHVMTEMEPFETINVLTNEERENKTLKCSLRATILDQYLTCSRKNQGNIFHFIF